MNDTVIIFGSSRSHGNTRAIIDKFLSIKANVDVIDLNDYNIGYFDYNFKNKDDDFFKVIDKVLEYNTIIFATPIYWYTMSAQLKTFFDRISDLLYGENKIIGRQLRGKNMASLSCGSDKEIFDGFTMPFVNSADYLGMTYKGHVHTWVTEDAKQQNNVINRLKEFAEKL